MSFGKRNYGGIDLKFVLVNPASGKVRRLKHYYKISIPKSVTDGVLCFTSIPNDFILLETQNGICLHPMSYKPADNLEAFQLVISSSNFQDSIQCFLLGDAYFTRSQESSGESVPVRIENSALKIPLEIFERCFYILESSGVVDIYVDIVESCLYICKHDFPPIYRSHKKAGRSFRTYKGAVRVAAAAAASVGRKVAKPAGHRILRKDVPIIKKIDKIDMTAPKPKRPGLDAAIDGVIVDESEYIP
jgi:hypothetical protein